MELSKAYSFSVTESALLFQEVLFEKNVKSVSGLKWKDEVQLWISMKSLQRTMSGYERMKSNDKASCN